MSTLIRGGTVVSASHASVADVLIDGEEIVAVGDVGDTEPRSSTRPAASSSRA
jgi:dihydroorotase-like cyclic amidohydrolase